MNNIHKRRLAIIAFSALGLAFAASLILYALRQNINAFLTPTELATTNLHPDYRCRLGGLVKKGSVIHDQHSLHVQFVITDFQHEMLVHYNGILPDLFREGKGVIAEGSMNENGSFTATQVLAKHDENYTPRKLQNMKNTT